MPEITERHIKQCDCDEIQNGHKWRFGDDFCLRSNREIVAVFTSGTAIDFPDALENDVNGKYIWIPRQEDVQEMILKKWKADEPSEEHSYHLLETNFNIFVNKRFPEENTINTLNELWVMFYMDEVRGKIKGDDLK